MYYSKKLKKIKTIKHCFFSRRNGFSKGMYKSLNCGIGSNDKNKNIIKNLNFVKKKLEINHGKLMTMRQTHSNRVLKINKLNYKNKRFNSDAIITSVKGLALGVLTADCVPIILFNETNNSIGCIHAGWKGSLSGIIENTLKKIKLRKKNNKIFACVGPCIGKKNYEVGKDLYDKFSRKSQSYKKFFSNKKRDKYLFDLRKFVNLKLKENDVYSIENIEKDTFAESDNFFSYRRAQKLAHKDYGRCISVIYLI